MALKGNIIICVFAIAAALYSYYYMLSPIPDVLVTEKSKSVNSPDGNTGINGQPTDERRRLEAVHSGLLSTESSATLSGGARIAVGFGGCLDVRGNALETLARSGVSPPEKPKNFNEINNWEELKDTFAYFFSHGASAGRLTDNDTLFDDLMTHMTSLDDTQLNVGGNAPVMTRRFRMEGVDVMLAARLSSALRLQIDPDVHGKLKFGRHVVHEFYHLCNRYFFAANIAAPMWVRKIVVGGEADKDDIHLILEYQRDAVWGPYTATRANRFILHNRGTTSFSSILKDFSADLASYKPSLLVVGGLRLLFGEHQKDQVSGSAPSLVELSSLLSSLEPAIRVHVEMSSFPDMTQLHDIVKHIIINQADSLGMNEQELPNIRRALRDLLGDVRSHCTSDPRSVECQDHEKIAVVSDSHPRISSTLDDMRAVFRLIEEHDSSPLGLSSAGLRRALSRLHAHTLAYQVIMTRRPVDQSESSTRPRRLEWKNMRAAAAKASLTSNRHTCGRHNIDLDNGRLLVDDSFLISREGNTAERRMFCNDSDPVTCWSEDIVDVCIAPVLVCKKVVQTVGGGDNVSAGGLVLQL